MQDLEQPYEARIMKILIQKPRYETKYVIVKTNKPDQNH